MNVLSASTVKFLERDTSLPTISSVAKSEIGKGGKVNITCGDEVYFVPIDKVTGMWTWTPSKPLSDGEYSISIQLIDNAGNNSKATLRTLIVDTTPPNPPMLLTMLDNQGAKVGHFDSGSITDDRRPELSGIAQKGTLVILKEGGTIIGSVQADAETGLWRMEPNVDLADGVHNLTLVAQETFAGKVREGAPSNNIVIEIGSDRLDPLPEAGNLATIDVVYDDIGTKGKRYSGDIIDDAVPKIVGTAPEDSDLEIQIRLNGGEWTTSSIGDITRLGTLWAWDVPLESGSYEFRANAGTGWSDVFKLTIGEYVAITHATDNVGATTDPLAYGATTDDHTPTLHGRGEPESLLNVFYRGSTDDWVNGSVVVNADGNWAFTPPHLPDGNYTFQATQSPFVDVREAYFVLSIQTPSSSQTINNAVMSINDDESIISVHDLLSDGAKNIFIDNDNTQLMVIGKVGDVLKLEDILPEHGAIDGWIAQTGTITIAGSEYQVYNSGDAELLVQDGIKIELI